MDDEPSCAAPCDHPPVATGCIWHADPISRLIQVGANWNPLTTKLLVTMPPQQYS
jgi:hypothetical protein